VVAERLEQALAILMQRTATGISPQAPTIAALCRLAHVSRNSLYRYHPDILAALRRHRARRGISPRAGGGSSTKEEVNQLRAQLAKIAALVDHFYTAYREARTLLERRERELAELRRTLALVPSVISKPPSAPVQ
jgi:AcrR family transcriptional regulator